MSRIPSTSMPHRSCLLFMFVLAAFVLTACGGGGGGSSGPAGSNSGTITADGRYFSGSLRTAGLTYYTLAAQAGTTYYIEVESLSGDIDLGLFSDRSFSAASFIDGSAFYSVDSTIDSIYFTAQRSRTYYIGLDAAEGGNYRLRVMVDSVIGGAGGGTPAGAITVNNPVTDFLRDGQEVYYQLTVSSTGNYRVTLNPADFDVDLEVYREGFSSLVDGSYLGGTDTDEVVFSATAGETYYILLNALGDSNYTLQVAPVRTINAELSATSLDFTAGRYDSVPMAQTVAFSHDGDVSSIQVVGSLPVWLSYTEAAITTPGELAAQIAITDTSLAPATYSATLRFTASDDSGQVSQYQDLAVHYTISDGLSVVQSSLGFNTILGSPTAPLAKSFNIVANGRSWTAVADRPWVQPAAGAGSGTTTLSVEIDPAGLGVGQHEATITIVDTDNGRSHTVTVCLDIAAPTLTVSNAAASITGINGKALPARSTQIQIDNGAVATWTASTDANWLMLNGIANSNTGTTADTLLLEVNAREASLTSGQYNTTVSISADVGGYTARTSVDVSLELTPMGFRLLPQAPDFSGINGADLGSQAVTFTLDTDIYDYNWTATPSADWIKLETGTSIGGSNSGNFPVTIDASTLASGSYDADITISAQVNGDILTHVLPVNLTLSPASLGVSQSTISFSGINGNDLGAQLVAISLNTGALAHDWSVVLDSDTGNWLQANVSNGTVSGDAGANIDLSVDSASMVGGNYSASATVSAQVNGDTLTETVTVDLKLEPHRLFVADNGVALSAFPTQTSRLSKTVTVSENAAVTTAWSAVADQAWLNVTADGSTDGDLVLAADPSGLSTDTIHYATVTVSSSDTSIENTETISVGLWVASADPVSPTAVSAPYTEIASDPVRPYVYAHSGAADIDVYNIYTAALVTTISGVGTQLGEMEVSSDGSMLYVADNAGFDVVPIDLASSTPGTAWDLSASGQVHLAYARPNGFAVLLLNDTSVRNAVTGEAVGPGFNTGSAALSASLNGKKFCGINSGLSPYSVVCYDMDYAYVDGEVLLSLVGTGRSGSNGRDVALSADGSRVYAAGASSGSPAPAYSFVVYDGASMSPVQYLPGTAYPNNIEVGPNGLIYASSIDGISAVRRWVYDPDGTALYSDGGSALIRQLIVSGDGSRILSANGGALVFINAP